jgi:tetratricopeptide (TPR) repeat protein
LGAGLVDSKVSDVVAQTDKIRVTRSLFDGDTIFVTFQSAIGCGFDQSGFGEKFFKDNRISAVHVVPVSPAWYQYEEILWVAAEIKKITGKYSRVVTYGTSMGGYAAINFAHLVGATDVIAISPQYTIDPKRAPAETRYVNAFNHFKDFVYDQPAGRDWASVDALIVFDPKDILDTYQANMARIDTSACLVPLRYSTHPSTQVLSINSLKQFLLHVAEHGVIASASLLQFLYRRDRHSSWYYWLTLARYGGRHSPDRAMKFLVEADRIQPDQDAVQYTIGLLHLARKDYAKALASFKKSTEINPEHPYYRAGMAGALIELGAPVQAKAAIAEGARKGLPAKEIDRLTQQLRKAKEIKRLAAENAKPEPVRLGRVRKAVKFFARYFR